MVTTPAPPTDAESQLKLALMQIINDDLQRRFDTMVSAADHVGISWSRLSKLRTGKHEQFSITWLFLLAKEANVRIRISVEPG